MSITYFLIKVKLSLIRYIYISTLYMWDTHYYLDIGTFV